MAKKYKIGDIRIVKNRKTGHEVTMERVRPFGKNRNLVWKIRKSKKP